MNQLRDAEKELGRLMAEEQDNERKLVALENYLEEYEDALQENARRGISSREWKTFNDFLDTIKKAIKEQRNVLDHHQVQTALGREQWGEKYREHASFESLREMDEARETKARMRQEQKRADEFASRAHATKKAVRASRRSQWDYDY